MKSTRREFLRSAAFSGAAFAFPSIIPASVLGADAPSNRIAIAQIGCGRIGLTMDVPGFLAAKGAQLVAACDLDSRRLEYMRGVIAKHYSADASSIVAARDFHDLLARKDIDAVSISTPDHWHAQIAVEAAFAGKDESNGPDIPPRLAAALMGALPRRMRFRARGEARQGPPH